MRYIIRQIVLIFLFVKCFPQISFTPSIEGGYFYSNFDNAISNRFLNRFKFNLTYKKEDTSFTFRTNLVYTPLLELDGFKFADHKIIITNSLYYPNRLIDINCSYNLTYNNYRIPSKLDYTIHTLTFFSQLSEMNVDFSTGFSNHYLDSFSQENIVRIFNSTNYQFINEDRKKISAALYVDYFKYNSSTHVSQKGYSAGLNLSYEYFSTFLVRADYKLLFHYFNDINQNSQEHVIKLAFAKYITDDISLHLIGNFSIPVVDDYLKTNINPLLYNSTIENIIYLKATKEITENTSMYIKTGYIDEEFTPYNIKLIGWNFSLGLDFDF